MAISHAQSLLFSVFQLLFYGWFSWESPRESMLPFKGVDNAVVTVNRKAGDRKLVAEEWIGKEKPLP